MEAHNKQQLIVVEDDRVLSSLIKDYFEDEGFKVNCLHTGMGASDLIIDTQPDAVVLDLDLPEVDGFEVCRKARKQFRKPIIMLTGHDSDHIEVSSLNMGADTYLQKPVKLSVLNAHVNALLRRERQYVEEINELNAQPHKTSSQELTIDEGSMCVKLAGRQIDLSYSEMSILSLLMKRKGQLVSRDELYREIRGFDYDGLDRTIDLKISSLRKKIKDTKVPYNHIKTVRGKGYLFRSQSRTD